MPQTEPTEGPGHAWRVLADDPALQREHPDFARRVRDMAAALEQEADRPKPGPTPWYTRLASG